MRKTITKKFLEKKEACSEGIEWFLDKNTKNTLDIIKLLKKEKKYNWLNWLLTRLMTKKQCIRYAIYAAEKVLHLYEKEYPDDNRPRKAILAAREYLKKPSSKNNNTAYAAHAAAYAAAYAAYDDAAAAADAAYAAYDAAVYAYAAAAAYAAADAAAYADAKEKIIKYGISLLEEN